MKRKILPKFVLLALLSVSLFSLYLMIYDWHATLTWQELTGLGAWSLSPYLLLTAYILKTRYRLKNYIIISTGSLLLVFISAAILTDGFFIHRDVFNGLIFYIIPPAQLLVVLITVVISLANDFS